MNVGQLSAFELAIDLGDLPTPTGGVVALPGETWHFQAWYRDRTSVAATTKFTPRVSVAFE
jgi:hypothetical protein